MSKLQELIARFCPDGVPFKSLGDLGTFYGGLTGKSKADFSEGNARYITYLNVYKNPAANLGANDFVKVNGAEKQNSIEYGDVIFTGSSETPNECGFTSVVVSEPNEKIYLNSFCFGFRLHNVSLFNPHFLKHLLRSDELRKEISKTASGVTRFNVSKKRLANVEIPVPPIEVQEEIVRILDRFSEYAAELQAELQARKEQYEYYRNLLLTFSRPACGCGTDDEQEIGVNTPPTGSYKVIFKPMGEVAKILRGKRLTKNDLIPDGLYAVYHGGLEPLGFYDKFNREGPCVMIINVGASAGTVEYSKNDFWSSDGCFCISKNDNLISKFLYYYLSNHQNNFVSKVRYAGIPTLDTKVINDFIIPIPPLEIQERIVAILDRFETLVNDLTKGLPAEIAAVKERYEYYRNKLLNFKPAA